MDTAHSQEATHEDFRLPQMISLLFGGFYGSKRVRIWLCWPYMAFLIERKPKCLKLESATLLGLAMAKAQGLSSYSSHL